jgi:Kef-type K+ transport system membrane component KefB
VDAGHADPFADVLLGMAVVVGAALVGRAIASRFRLASVLGELGMGVALGNLAYQLGNPLAARIMHGFDIHELLHSSEPGDEGLRVVLISLWVFSNLGVILLLLMVGLESSVSDLMRVGARALAVAIAGVVAPFALGYATSLWLLPEAATTTHLFSGATLCATSVGITARVLRDLGQMQSPAARVILGAAVIDDVLGLMILAVIVGIVATGAVELGAVAKITLLSAAFLLVVLWFGERLGSGAARILSALERRNAKLLAPLLLAFATAWLVNQIGLAAIIGAFAAGLLLRDEHFTAKDGGPESLHAILAPLESVFAPVFFVVIGMQVNLELFASPATLALGGALTVVAIASKLVAGAFAGPGANKWVVGVGMVPRGEVGLIFASIGKTLGVVDGAEFSAVVMMVIATTLFAPIALDRLLRASD